MGIGKLRKLNPLVAVLVAGFACRRAPSGTAAPSSPSANLTAGPAARSAVIDACTLLTANEVGAILGKRLKASGQGAQCTYETDPAEREQRLADAQGKIREETHVAGRTAAKDGDWGASFSSMSRSVGRNGGGLMQLSQSMADLTHVTFDAARDDRTEEQIKSAYASTGRIVRGVTSPEKHGVSGTITAGKDLPGVGDWAFSTNVAAVSMGPGFSSRGRLLHARKGPWHVTVGATLSPDPGEEAMDASLSAIARAAFERLAASRN
jgi:hypothetical protein